MMKRALLCCLLACLLAGTAVAGCGTTTVNEREGCEPGLAGEQVSEALNYFALTRGDKEIIKYACADLNGDAGEDLVVIFRESKEKNSMLVVLVKEGEFQCTNEVAAPVSNQVITFKDIDDKPPLEFIVQGMKGSNLGYAIYRVEGSILEDLFGEGMEDCC